jgi:hypothetical protein
LWQLTQNYLTVADKFAPLQIVAAKGNKEMRNIYSETYYINIGKEIYQLQALDTSDGAFFLLKYWDKLICTIRRDEQNEWQVNTDIDIEWEVLSQILKWIEKIFM